MILLSLPCNLTTIVNSRRKNTCAQVRTWIFNRICGQICLNRIRHYPRVELLDYETPDLVLRILDPISSHIIIQANKKTKENPKREVGLAWVNKMNSNKQREELIEKYNTIDENFLSEKRKILNDLENCGGFYVEDNIKPDSNLCIILSCPGESELKADKVCAGDTGENLDKILEIILTEEHGILESKEAMQKSHNRYKYNIINSVQQVYFRAYNAAEAEPEDIEKENNIKRAKENIQKIRSLKYVIVCGENADFLYSLIKSSIEEGVKIAKICHIGFVGLRNHYRNNCDELKGIKSGTERDKKRIEMIAKEILKQWN